MEGYACNLGTRAAGRWRIPSQPCLWSKTQKGIAASARKGMGSYYRARLAWISQSSGWICHTVGTGSNLHQNPDAVEGSGAVGVYAEVTPGSGEL